MIYLGQDNFDSYAIVRGSSASVYVWGAGPTPLLAAAPQVGDLTVFGHNHSRFTAFTINPSAVGSGTWTITWKYYDVQSGWTTIPGWEDPSNGFRANLAQWLIETSVCRNGLPTWRDRWVRNDIAGSTRYWIAACLSSFNLMTVRPTGSSASAYLTMPNSNQLTISEEIVGGITQTLSGKRYQDVFARKKRFFFAWENIDKPDYETALTRYTTAGSATLYLDLGLNVSTSTFNCVVDSPMDAEYRPPFLYNVTLTFLEI